MSTLGRPPVMLDIVEEHFDELDFLWEHREGNVFTPDWTWYNLVEHEERVEAHLDGLRLAELHGVDIAFERIGGGTTSAAAAATFVLCEAGEPRCFEVVLEHLQSEKPAIVDGVRSALRHCDVRKLESALFHLAVAGAPSTAAAAADVLAFHRLGAPPLDKVFAGDAASTHKLALDAAVRLGSLQRDSLTNALEHAEPIVRRSALYAAARAGIPGLVRWCRSMATRGTDPDAEAVSFLGIVGEEQDLELLQAAMRRSDLAEDAVAAVGALGRVAAIPWLIELMADKALGVFATSAYRRITGASHVEGSRPFPPPPVAEGEDEDENLPPDPAKAAADWKQRSKTMTADRAWQSGVAINDVRLPPEFDRLTLQSRRYVFARLCSRGSMKESDMELEALAVRQRRA